MGQNYFRVGAIKKRKGTREGPETILEAFVFQKKLKKSSKPRSNLWHLLVEAKTVGIMNMVRENII